MSSSGLETRYDGPDTVQPEPGAGSSPVWRRGVILAAAALAVALLFGLCLRHAWAARTGSDGAVMALQARDMLGGNLLLRGWTLPDMTFYTIELPELMLAELARGLNTGDVHLVEALNYTLLVVLAALLAKGRTGGREGILRAAVAAGILLAPGPGVAGTVAFANPDHLGTQLLVLAAWLIADRSRPCWQVPVAVALLLGWAQVSDGMTLIEGILPLLAVSAMRAYRGRHGPLRALWYDLSLGAAAVAAGLAANLALSLIRQAGGFRAYPLTYSFAYVDALSSHVWLTAETVLALFGADFSGQRLSPQAPVGVWTALIHLAGVALACWALAVAARRFTGHDRVVQLMAVAVAVVLGLFTTLGGFDVGGGAHDILPVLPFGAVLAGRLLAARLIRRDLVLALVVPLACSAALFASVAVQPARPADGYQRVASWLRARHFRYGLADYWTASAVALDAGGRVQVVPVMSKSFRIDVAPWNSEASWYDPGRHRATFMVLPAVWPGCPAGTAGAWETAARNTFGRPERTFAAGAFQVLVWHQNLLRAPLTPLPPARPGAC